MRARTRLLLSVLLGLSCCLPAAAGDGTMALGRDGEIYRLRVGEYGALIPDAPADLAKNTIVALERTTAGKSPVRLLVPTTDSSAVEKYPSLTVDPRTQSVVIVWEARAVIHSTLHVVTLVGDEWSPVYNLYGDPFSEKLNPRVATTTDSYRALDGNGDVVDRTRLVVHLVWFDRLPAVDRPLYIPLVFEDGKFLPNWNVLDLQTVVDEAAPTATEKTLPAGLYENPEIEASGGGSSAIIAFASPASGRLTTVECRPVSGGLVSWSDEARNQVIDTGRTLTDRRAIADKARNQVIDTGRRLLARDAADLLALKFLDAIASSDPAESLESVTDKARNQVIDTGARLDASGTRGMVAKSTAESTISLWEPFDEPARTPHLGVLSVVASWPAPSLPNRALRLIPSGEGGDLAIAWDVDGSVKYRMTQGSGWSEIRSLALGSELTRDGAYELIEQRLRRR